MIRIAILDDYQNVSLEMADWSPLAGRAEITVFNDHLSNLDAIVERLRPFDVVCVMRERTPVPTVSYRAVAAPEADRIDRSTQRGRRCGGRGPSEASSSPIRDYDCRSHRRLPAPGRVKSHFPKAHCTCARSGIECAFLSGGWAPVGEVSYPVWATTMLARPRPPHRRPRCVDRSMRSASGAGNRSITDRGTGVRSRMTQTTSNGRRRSTMASKLDRMVVENGDLRAPAASGDPVGHLERHVLDNRPGLRCGSFPSRSFQQGQPDSPTFHPYELGVLNARFVGNQESRRRSLHRAPSRRRALFRSAGRASDHTLFGACYCCASA